MNVNTLSYFKSRFGFDSTQEMPIDLPDFSRFDMAAMFHVLGFDKDVEVGVERGYFSEALCKANPDLHLYCVDPWVTYESGHIEHRTPETVAEFMEQAKKRLSKYNVTIIRQGSIKASTKFKHNTLDFVYIDGDHGFEATINDCAVWSKRVRPGGIIAGHDYYDNLKDPILRTGPAVRLFTKAFDISPWFTFGRAFTNLGFKFKRDSCRSFMWIKE
jgi:hypothetical protein